MPYTPPVPQCYGDWWDCSDPETEPEKVLSKDNLGYHRIEGGFLSET